MAQALYRQAVGVCANAVPQRRISIARQLRNPRDLPRQAVLFQIVVF